MNKATVQPGQTIADIAIQYTGSLDTLALIANLNGVSLTSDLISGQVLILPDVSDKRTVAFFKSGSYFPAAGSVLVTGEGIGYMGIEFDFIVA